MANVLSTIGSALGSAASAASPVGWLGSILSIVDKVIPDPTAKAQAQLAVLQLQQSGQLAEEQNSLQQSLAQIDLDKTEAASTSFFRSGWRPYVGWICGTGLCYQFLLQPLVAWLSLIKHWPVPPTLDLSTLVTILGALLGFGGYRSFEKVKGLS
jgi:Holin of 3TMs, for gene-transfer release